MTFASNLATGDVIDFVQILGNVLDIGQPSDDTVKTASLQANAVTGAKLNTDVISAQTALGAEPADTDEFLVSDAGVLKRVDYSYIKGGGITVADQWRITSTYTYPSSGSKVLTSNWERIDTDSPGYIGSAMTESSGIFTFPSTGKYLIHFFVNVAATAASNYIGFYIEVTEDNSSYSYLAANWDSADAANRSLAVSAQGLFDVTDTSRALHTFNGGNWYGWKTHDDSGNKIPNADRMQYKYIKVIKEGATIPSEADVNAKIQELKDAETTATNKKASGKQKLKDLGLDDDEIKALMGA
jgi:hypothetical protein